MVFIWTVLGLDGADGVFPSVPGMGAADCLGTFFLASTAEAVRTHIHVGIETVATLRVVQKHPKAVPWRDQRNIAPRL